VLIAPDPQVAKVKQYFTHDAARKERLVTQVQSRARQNLQVSAVGWSQDACATTKPGSLHGMDTRRKHKSEQSKRRRNLRLTNRSTKPYPWPPKRSAAGCLKAGPQYIRRRGSSAAILIFSTQLPCQEREHWARHIPVRMIATRLA